MYLATLDTLDTLEFGEHLGKIATLILIFGAFWGLNLLPHLIRMASMTFIYKMSIKR
jgi:hypothetical protein